MACTDKLQWRWRESNTLLSAYEAVGIPFPYTAKTEPGEDQRLPSLSPRTWGTRTLSRLSRD